MSNIESGSDVDELCSMTRQTSLNGPRLSKLSSVCEEVSGATETPITSFITQIIYQCVYVFIMHNNRKTV